MRRVGCSIGTMGLVAVLSSCYPGEISSAGETDLVVTGARPDYTFNKKTYFMPDAVFYIQADSMAPDTFDHSFDDDILNAVATGLASFGFNRLPQTADPGSADVLVINTVAVNTNVSFWTYWPGYYPPYWGCCYGGYPWWPVSGAMAWRPGTVLTLMQDPDLASSANQDSGEVWIGAMNGLVEGSQGAAATRITTGIAQAFVQSPYLSGSSPN